MVKQTENKQETASEGSAENAPCHSHGGGDRSVVLPLMGKYVSFSGFDSVGQTITMGSMTESGNDATPLDTSGGQSTQPFVDTALQGVPSLSVYRDLAARLGAHTQTIVTRKTNILVTQRGLTRKRLVAQQHGIPVVRPQWLDDFAKSLSGVGTAPRPESYTVPWLFGYDFCVACGNMPEGEYAALEVILQQHGAIVSKTLTTATDAVLISSEEAERLHGKMFPRRRTILHWEAAAIRKISKTNRDTIEDHANREDVNHRRLIDAAEKLEIPVLEYRVLLRLARLTAGGVSQPVTSGEVLNNVPLDRPLEETGTSTATGAFELTSSNAVKDRVDFDTLVSVTRIQRHPEKCENGTAEEEEREDTGSSQKRAKSRRRDNGITRTHRKAMRSGGMTAAEGSVALSSSSSCSSSSSVSSASALPTDEDEEEPQRIYTADYLEETLPESLFPESSSQNGSLIPASTCSPDYLSLPLPTAPMEPEAGKEMWPQAATSLATSPAVGVETLLGQQVASFYASSHRPGFPSLQAMSHPSPTTKASFSSNAEDPASHFTPAPPVIFSKSVPGAAHSRAATTMFCLAPTPSAFAAEWTRGTTAWLPPLEPEFGPYVTISLLGCSEEEVRAAVRYCGRCRFVLSAVPTPRNDVLVLGTRLVRRKKFQKQPAGDQKGRRGRGLLSARLEKSNHESAAGYIFFYEASNAVKDVIQAQLGVHPARLVPFAWLRECYAVAQKALPVENRPDTLDPATETCEEHACSTSTGDASPTDTADGTPVVMAGRVKDNLHASCLHSIPAVGSGPFRIRFRTTTADTLATHKNTVRSAAPPSASQPSKLIPPSRVADPTSGLSSFHSSLSGGKRGRGEAAAASSAADALPASPAPSVASTSSAVGGVSSPLSSFSNKEGGGFHDSPASPLSPLSVPGEGLVGVLGHAETSEHSLTSRSHGPSASQEACGSPPDEEWRRLRRLEEEERYRKEREMAHDLLAKWVALVQHEPSPLLPSQTLSALTHSAAPLAVPPSLSSAALHTAEGETKLPKSVQQLFRGTYFCFLNNEFSRVDCAVVRSLIKLSGGRWMKKEAAEWRAALAKPKSKRMDVNKTIDTSSSQHRSTSKRGATQDDWTAVADHPVALSAADAAFLSVLRRRIVEERRRHREVERRLAARSAGPAGSHNSNSNSNSIAHVQGANLAAADVAATSNATPYRVEESSLFSAPPSVEAPFSCSWEVSETDGPPPPRFHTSLDDSFAVEHAHTLFSLAGTPLETEALDVHTTRSTQLASLSAAPPEMPADKRKESEGEGVAREPATGTTASPAASALLPAVYHVVPHHYQMPPTQGGWSATTTTSTTQGSRQGNGRSRTGKAALTRTGSQQRPPPPSETVGSATAGIPGMSTPSALTSSFFPHVPQVTSDYLLCCMAAQQRLDPRSFFLFHTPLPSEAELALRAHRRTASGQRCSQSRGRLKRAEGGAPAAPPPLSEWVWQRRYRKPDTVGIAISFLYRIPAAWMVSHEVSATTTTTTTTTVHVQSPSPAGLSVLKVLLLSLHHAVKVLGGVVQDEFNVNSVTHVMLVDVAAVYANRGEEVGSLDADNHEGISLVSADIGGKSDAEACGGATFDWPSSDCDAICDDSLTEEDVCFVTTTWLEDCVRWGFFLEERVNPLYKWKPSRTVTPAMWNHPVLTEKEPNKEGVLTSQMSMDPGVETQGSDVAPSGHPKRSHSHSHSSSRDVGQRHGEHDHLPTRARSARLSTSPSPFTSATRVLSRTTSRTPEEERGWSSLSQRCTSVAKRLREQLSPRPIRHGRMASENIDQGGGGGTFGALEGSQYRVSKNDYTQDALEVNGPTARSVNVAGTTSGTSSHVEPVNQHRDHALNSLVVSTLRTECTPSRMNEVSPLKKRNRREEEEWAQRETPQQARDLTQKSKERRIASPATEAVSMFHFDTPGRTPLPHSLRVPPTHRHAESASEPQTSSQERHDHNDPKPSLQQRQMNEPNTEMHSGGDVGRPLFFTISSDDDDNSERDKQAVDTAETKREETQTNEETFRLAAHSQSNRIGHPTQQKETLGNPRQSTMRPRVEIQPNTTSTSLCAVKREESAEVGVSACAVLEEGLESNSSITRAVPHGPASFERNENETASSEFSPSGQTRCAVEQAERTMQASTTPTPLLPPPPQTLETCVTEEPGPSTSEGTGSSAKKPKKRARSATPPPVQLVRRLFPGLGRVSSIPPEPVASACVHSSAFNAPIQQGATLPTFYPYTEDSANSRGSEVVRSDAVPLDKTPRHSCYVLHDVPERDALLNQWRAVEEQNRRRGIPLQHSQFPLRMVSDVVNASFVVAHELQPRASVLAATAFGAWLVRPSFLADVIEKWSRYTKATTREAEAMESDQVLSSIVEQAREKHEWSATRDHILSSEARLMLRRAQFFREQRLVYGRRAFQRVMFVIWRLRGAESTEVSSCRDQQLDGLHHVILSAGGDLCGVINAYPPEGKEQGVSLLSTEDSESEAAKHPRWRFTVMPSGSSSFDDEREITSDQNAGFVGGEFSSDGADGLRGWNEDSRYSPDLRLTPAYLETILLAVMSVGLQKSVDAFVSPHLDLSPHLERCHEKRHLVLLMDDAFLNHRMVVAESPAGKNGGKERQRGQSNTTISVSSWLPSLPFFHADQCSLDKTGASVIRDALDHLRVALTSWSSDKKRGKLFLELVQQSLGSAVLEPRSIVTKASTWGEECLSKKRARAEGGATEQGPQTVQKVAHTPLPHIPCVVSIGRLTWVLNTLLSEDSTLGGASNSTGCVSRIRPLVRPLDDLTEENQEATHPAGLHAEGIPVAILNHSGLLAHTCPIHVSPSCFSWK